MDFAALIGYGVADWQRTPLADWSRLDGRGKFVHRRCGMSVPRQAGKSHDAIIWTAFLVLELGYCVLWTDHNYSTTCEMLDRFRTIFGKRANDPNAPRAINRRVKDSKAKTAQEQFMFTNGGVLCFSTRTDAASLGYSFDVIVYDEAQKLTAGQVQTLEPTKSHAPHKNSQSVFVGTPTRAGEPQAVFRDMRAEAWDDAPGDDLCWLEYGTAEVGDPLDETRWPTVNPSLAEGLVEVEDIRTGVLVMRNDALGIAQEYLGYWVPDAEAVDPPLLSADEWAACEVAEGPAPRPGERVAYGVKFSAGGATVCVAGAVLAPGSDTPHVELARCESTASGTAWLASWLMERGPKACSVAVDGRSGAGALCDRMEQARAPRGYVMRPTADQAVIAANEIYEGVRTGAVTHIADEALALSATTSTRRPIGKAGGWGWGGECPEPMEACGLALWALRSSKRNPARKGKAG